MLHIWTTVITFLFTGVNNAIKQQKQVSHYQVLFKNAVTIHNNINIR